MQTIEPRNTIVPSESTLEKREMTELLGQLKLALKNFCGIDLRADPMRGWEIFITLPETTKTAIKGFIKGQTAFIQEAVAAGVEPKSEKAMLRHALSKLRIICDESIFDEVEETDVIEILDQNLAQMYRSFSCFAICNYSVLELTTIPFFDLYERSSAITKILVEACGEIFEGKTSFKSLRHIGSYPVREILTPEKNSFVIQEKFVARSLGCLDSNTYAVSVKRVRETNEPNDLKLAFI